MPKKPFQRGQKFRPIFSLGMSHVNVQDLKKFMDDYAASRRWGWLITMVPHNFLCRLFLSRHNISPSYTGWRGWQIQIWACLSPLCNPIWGSIHPSIHSSKKCKLTDFCSCRRYQQFNYRQLLEGIAYCHKHRVLHRWLSWLLNYIFFLKTSSCFCNCIFTTKGPETSKSVDWFHWSDQTRRLRPGQSFWFVALKFFFCKTRP